MQLFFIALHVVRVPLGTFDISKISDFSRFPTRAQSRRAEVDVDCFLPRAEPAVRCGSGDVFQAFEQISAIRVAM
jgi:hypothetical protein